MNTVLLLGASRGIGLELARQYAASGDRVIATARTPEGLARLAALGVQALRLDVTEPASVGALAGQLDGQRIDIAIYVAGVTSRGDASAPPARPAFDAVMHANVLGAMQVIAHVGPAVAAAGGRMGFVSSAMGRIATADDSHAWVYRASKAALNMAVVAAQSTYPGAIMVCLHPGWVQTGMGGARAPLAVPESCAGLRRVMAGLTPADRGTFIQYDGQRLDTW